MLFKTKGKLKHRSKRALVGVALIAVLSCSLAFGGDPVASRFRQMVKEVLIASSDESPSDAPDRLKQVLLKYPDVIEKVMSERDLDPILKEADLVDGEIGSLGRKLSDFREEMINRQSSWRKWLLGFRQKFLPEVKVNWVAHLNESDLRALSSELQTLISGIDFSGSEVMAELLKFEDGKAKTASKLISRYFDKLPTEKKKAIVIKALSLPPGAPLVDKLEAVLQELGPGAQKAIQLLGEESKSEVMKATSKRLLASVKPFVVTEKMKKDLEAAWGQPFDSIFSEFDDNPVKAGTIGQVHRGKLKKTGETVYTKLRRPEIDQELRADLLLFKDISQDEPLLLSLVERMERSMLKEGDFLAEATNITDLHGYSRPDLRVDVVRLTPGVPPTENALIMNEVRGIPLSELDLSQLSDAERRQLSESMKNLMGLWFDQAIFSSDGIYHGDPHAGNILVSRSSTPPYFRLGVVDAGNVGRIPLKTRRAFVELMLTCLNSSRPQDAVEALGQFGRFDVKTRNALYAKLSPVFADRSLSPMARMQEVMKAALEAGIPLPDEIVGLERARTFLERKYGEIIKGLKPAATAPMAIYTKVAAKRVTEELPRGVILRESVVVTPSMVTKYLGRNPQEVLRALDIGAQSPGLAVELADHAISNTAGCLIRALKGPDGLLSEKK